jgi:hypothetical protein
LWQFTAFVFFLLLNVFFLSQYVNEL